MRFETSNSTPPHLNRRLQLRMLGFVGLIGLIMFVMTALQPKPQKKDRPLPGAPDPAIFQVQGENGILLKDDEFISRPVAEDPTRDPKPREQPWQEPSDGRNPAEVRNELDQEIAKLETGFDKSILRRVKDNTIGIRSDEADAYYHLLNHANRVSATELERAGATDVLYINLMTDPDRFRGVAITIHGDLWRLYEFKAGPNKYGFKSLYEAWVFTADSDNHPYRIVFTKLPRDLEPGENLRRPVRVTGYFFKREGYASSGGMHVTPTMLAQRVIPFLPPNAPPRTDAILPYMIGLISAIGLAFLVTLASFAISDRRAAKKAALRDLNAPAPSFAGIDAGPMLTVQQSLQQMEEEEWESAESNTNYRDVSASLHARDRVSTLSESHPAPSASEEESAERLRDETQAVQAWTQRHGSRNGSPDSLNHPHSEPAVGLNDSPNPEQSIVELTDADALSPRNLAPPGAGLSKLAAWENEIQQIAGQGTTGSVRMTEDERAAAADLERDHALREQELADRLQHQRAELQLEQEEREASEQAARADHHHAADESTDGPDEADDSDSSYDQALRRRRRRDGR